MVVGGVSIYCVQVLCGGWEHKGKPAVAIATRVPVALLKVTFV